MNIALIYCNDVKYGGWVTYTHHLYNVISTFGKCAVFRFGKKFRQVVKESIPTVYLDGKDKVRMSKVLNQFDIIHIVNAVCEKEVKRFKFGECFPEYNILALCRKPIIMTYHDPGECKSSPKSLQFSKSGKISGFLYPRPQVKSFFDSLGFTKNSKYLPKPFIRSCATSGNNKENEVVSISRLDYDKYLEFLIQASNTINYPIKIYGFANRLYVFHKLEKLGWTLNNSMYKGEYSNEERNIILSKAKLLVDMSAIANDGGGTQYTFLEAFDCGTIPILNSKWIVNPDTDELKNGINFIAVATSAELSMQVNSIMENEILLTKIRSNNYKFLEEYSLNKLSKLYYDYYKSVLK
uniref:Putative glycosyltransferase n=1 Tax=viral metagenome TaxID=1070528 RepID=A0A6M3IJG5_9ZZZZ